MRLFLVRHAIAVERGTLGIPDDERPLTEEGRARFRKAAAGLAKVESRPKTLLSSPLPRAFETAQILSEAWGGPKPVKTPVLVGGTFEEILKVVGNPSEDTSIALVGHEPHLSMLLGVFLGGVPAERVAFRKGGVALLEFDGPLSGGGRLIYMLPPRVLRSLA